MPPTPTADNDAPARSAERSADPLIGIRVGEYHIRRVLGRGGMGVVYEAEDTALGIPVALKSISAAFARDATFVRRFRTEARAMARVASPHIVRVMALRETEHGLFIVMEYVDGGDLHARMAGGPMPWTAVWPLLRQMLLGLEAAHAVGVIHRDIKPRNVLLTSDGTVKLTDFGLARLQSDGEATVTQAVAGTLAYMSPEQIRALPSLDGRSDLFSLGLTAYEALAGRLPFDRSTGEFTVMQAIVDKPFPPPTEFTADVSPAVAHALMRVLEKDPEARYPSAAAMRDALAAAGDDAGATRTRAPSARRAPVARRAATAVAVAGAPPASAVPPPATPAVPDTRPARRPLPLALLVGAGALLVAGAVYWATRPDPSVGPAGAEVDVETAAAEVPAGGEVATGGAASAPVSAETAPGTTSIPAGAPPVSYAPGPPTQTQPTQTQQAPPRQPPPSSGPQGPSMGTVDIEVDAGVTLSVDGSGMSSGSRDFRPGTYTAVCAAGPLSETTRVTVTPNQRTPVRCYASERVVSVSAASDDAERPWMGIVVDGQAQGQTPGRVTLPTGRHTVFVRRRGFSVDGDDTQTVDVPPRFSPGPHAPVSLTFRVRSDAAPAPGY